MIKKILAHNFKGLSFEQPLEQYNLFLGPNGTGKSARSQGLTLAIMGYLPSDAKKNLVISLPFTRTTDSLLP